MIDRFSILADLGSRSGVIGGTKTEPPIETPTLAASSRAQWLVKIPEMNSYPPGAYVADAMMMLPAPGPDVQPITVQVDAGVLWGCYKITFEARRNPRQGMTSWFWTMKSGERIDVEGKVR